MLTANHDHRSNANAAATATAALNDVDALAAGESSTLSLAPPLDARAVRLARKQARKSKQQQQRRNSASAARSIPTTAARDTQRAWTLLPWRRRAVVDDDDSLELASAAEAQDEQLVALATSTESMPHPYVSASAAASNDVDESQSAVSTSTTTAGVEPHSSLTVPAAGTSPISADARWETLFDTIRPLFSRSIVPSRKMTSASGGQGSRVTSPTSPTSPNSPVEHTTTQSPPPIAPLQLAPPQVLVMEHHDESTPVTPSTPNTIRSKKLSRRATIDTSSIFATLRRQRTPAMSPETPVATTPELDEEALTELPETAVTANDTNSSNGSAMNEESATSSLDRRKTVFFVEPSAPVTSEPSMYKSLPRTLFASSRYV